MRLILSSRNQRSLEEVARECYKIAEASAAAAAAAAASGPNKRTDEASSLDAESDASRAFHRVTRSDDGTELDVGELDGADTKMGVHSSNRHERLRVLILPLDLEKLSDDFDLAKQTVQKAIGA